MENNKQRHDGNYADMLKKEIDVIKSEIKTIEFCKGANDNNSHRLYDLMLEKEQELRKVINLSSGTKDSCCSKCKSSGKKLGIVITCMRFRIDSAKDYKCDYYDSPKVLK